MKKKYYCFKYVEDDSGVLNKRVFTEADEMLEYLGNTGINPAAFDSEIDKNGYIEFEKVLIIKGEQVIPKCREIATFWEL